MTSLLWLALPLQQAAKNGTYWITCPQGGSPTHTAPWTAPLFCTGKIQAQVFLSCATEASFTACCRWQGEWASFPHRAPMWQAWWGQLTHTHTHTTTCSTVFPRQGTRLALRVRGGINSPTHNHRLAGAEYGEGHFSLAIPPYCQMKGGVRALMHIHQARKPLSSAGCLHGY